MKFMTKRAVRRLTLSFVFSVSLATGVFAAGADKGAAMEELRLRLQNSFDGIRIERVMPSSTWPGLYEVATETELAYTNAQGSQLIIGNIIDAKTKENVTAKRWRELNSIDVTKLPLANAIKKVKGSGERKLFVFSDPDCPYCKKLEKTLQEVDNVTIYTFLYPLEDLHPDARAKADRIWCSADRIGAWEAWMLNGVSPKANCANSVVDSNIKLGGSYKITGTPAIYFADGRRVDGAIPKEAIEKELSGWVPN